MEELEKIKITSTNLRSILTRATNSLSKIKIKRQKRKRQTFPQDTEKKKKIRKKFYF